MAVYPMQTAVGQQFGPQIPSWLQRPEVPRGGPWAPAPGGQGQGLAGMGGQGIRGFMGMGGGGAGQTPGLANPWVQGRDAIHTPISTGIDAISAANIAGLYNPNVDPLMDRIRSQAFQDNIGRQNAGRLSAQIHGGGDPYLTAFSSLMGGMQGQSDLARILSQAQLARGTQREEFFQNLLMQMLQGSYGKLANDAMRQPGGLGQLLGQLGGGILGSLPFGSRQTTQAPAETQ